jgi:hypothetical protein
MKKTIVTTLAFSVLMGAAVAQAGNIPEYDAVGDDSKNYFASQNSAQYGQVIANNFGQLGLLEIDSAFRQEKFTTNAGWLYNDPVFPGMLSALTDAYNQGSYTWDIVLQMKPESDLNINIYDSVLKHNAFGPWYPWLGAEQTGRYRAPWGQLIFVPSANPMVTVEAIAGSLQFVRPGTTVNLCARTIPGLRQVPLNKAVYTSKCLWADDIVVVMPETGTTNAAGQEMFNLKQGDTIRVKIDVPYNNTGDIRYGQDSVTVKYIGVYFTELYGDI